MNTLQLFKKITCFVFDVDGVLTDGSVLLLENGILARKMSIKDGYALQLAIKKNYRVKVISGSNSTEVTERLRKLGVTDVTMGVEDKKELLEKYLNDMGLNKDEVLYMGDDIPDLEAMKLAGLATCPSDAVQEIKQAAQYISHLKGGKACVRDVIEKAMKLRGDWSFETSNTSS